MNRKTQCQITTVVWAHDPAGVTGRPSPLSSHASERARPPPLGRERILDVEAHLLAKDDHTTNEIDHQAKILEVAPPPHIKT